MHLSTVRRGTPERGGFEGPPQVFAKLSRDAAETLSSLPFSYAEIARQSVIYAPGGELDQYLVLVAGSVCRDKVAPSGEQVICSFEFPELSGIAIG